MYKSIPSHPFPSNVGFRVNPEGDEQGFLSGQSNEYLCACVLSLFSHVQLFSIPWTVAHQAPLSMGFSRQEYWSGFPCPPPGNLSDPGIQPPSLMYGLAGGFFTISATWETFLLIDPKCVQFSRSVMSNSSQPHESQHAKPPCPSPTSRIYSDSRPSSR